MPAGKFSPRYWLLVADRVYTRNVAEAGAGGRFYWSAPPDLERGDVVLLYERGKRDFSDQPAGRKEIGWLMRALSGSKPDDKWGHSAWFLTKPLKFPLPLSQAKASAAVRDWGPMRGGLQGHNGNFAIPPPVWQVLRRSIEKYNPGFADTLERWAGSRPREFKYVGPLDAPKRGEDVRSWRSEDEMEPVILDLIDHEGWAHQLDLDDKRFGRPSSRGFYLPHEGWYADYLLRLGAKQARHILVVEFERSALGDRGHGATQADEYCKALKRHHRGWMVSGVVIAQDFNKVEFEIAEDLEVECLRASKNPRGQPELTDAGGYRGPVYQARRRAARARRPWRVGRRKPSRP